MKIQVGVDFDPRKGRVTCECLEVLCLNEADEVFVRNIWK